LFFALILIILISIFLSITYISGISKQNTVDKSINYIPTLQSGYFVTQIDLSFAHLMKVQQSRSISTIPALNPTTPTQSRGSMYELSSTLSPKEYDKYQLYLDEKLYKMTNFTQDLFGFFGVISHDGLPTFSFVGHGPYFYFLHCENLMCSESSLGAVDLGVFDDVYEMTSQYKEIFSGDNYVSELVRGQEGNLANLANFGGKKDDLLTTNSITIPTNPITDPLTISPFTSTEGSPYWYGFSSIPIPIPKPTTPLFWSKNGKIPQQYKSTIKYLNSQFSASYKKPSSQNQPKSAEKQFPENLYPTDPNFNVIKTKTYNFIENAVTPLIPLNATTKIVLTPHQTPAIVVSLDNGQLFLVICSTTQCRDDIRHVTLIHPATELSAVIQTTSHGMLIAFSTKSRPIPNIKAGALYLTICHDYYCDDLSYRLVVGLFVRNSSSLSLGWQIESGLTIVFPGYWLSTPIPLRVLSLIPDVNNGSDLVPGHFVDLLQFEMFTTVSMHPFLAVSFVQVLKTMGWLKEFSGVDGVGSFEQQGIGMTNGGIKMRKKRGTVRTFQHNVGQNGDKSGDDSGGDHDKGKFGGQNVMDFWEINIDPFSHEFIDQISGMIFQFYDIDTKYGYSGNRIDFGIEFDQNGNAIGARDEGMKVNAMNFVDDAIQNGKLFPLKQPIFSSKLPHSRQATRTHGINTASESGSEHHMDGRIEFEFKKQEVNFLSEIEKIEKILKFRAKVRQNPNLYPSSISHLSFIPQTSLNQHKSYNTTFPNGDVHDIPSNGLILDKLTPEEFVKIAQTILKEIQLLTIQYTGLPYSYYQTDPSNPTVLEPKTLYVTCQAQCRLGTTIITLPLASHPAKHSVEVNGMRDETHFGESPSGTKVDSKNITDFHENSLNDVPSAPPNINVSELTTIASTDIEGRMRDVFTLDGDSKMTILFLYDSLRRTDSNQHLIKQSLSSFRCNTHTCRQYDNEPTWLEGGIELFEPSNTSFTQTQTTTDLTSSLYYKSLFSGALDTLTPILTNLTNVTHLSVDSDPFFISYQYLLFDLDGIPMYSRCFDNRCNSLHVQPLLSFSTTTTQNPNFLDLTKTTKASLFEPIDSLANQPLLPIILNGYSNTIISKQDMGTTMETAGAPLGIKQSEMGLNNVSSDWAELLDTSDSSTDGLGNKTKKPFTCMSVPCFSITLSPIDSMVLIIVGNRNTSIVHCSNMFCLPYHAP
jgi:hypothetical protein